MPRRLALASAAVIALMAISFLFTRWPDGTLVVSAPAVYLGFALFAAAAIRTESDLRVTAIALVVSGVIVAAIAIVQVLTGWYLWRQGELDVLGRANATFADPNIAARMLGIVVIVLAAGLTARTGRRRTEILMFGALAVVVAGLVMTESRWPWAALAVVLLGWLAVERRNARAYVVVGVVVIAFAASAAINATAMMRAGEVVSGVVDSIGGEGDGPIGGNLDPNQPTTYAPPRSVIGHDIFQRLPIDGVRLYLLEAGVAMWEDNVVTGVGTGGFRPMLAGPYREFIPRDRRSQPVLLNHSSLGQLAAENGWVGVAALAAFLAAMALSVRRGVARGSALVRSASIASGLAILLVFLTSQAEGRFFSEPYLWLGVGVIGSLELLASRPPIEETSDMSIADG
jgi:O-antigen ligase